MSDDKKTCSMCERFEKAGPAKGRCRAPVPFWVADGLLVSANNRRAAECNCFEPLAEKVEGVPFA